jgi:hypothetical protein
MKVQVRLRNDGLEERRGVDSLGKSRVGRQTKGQVQNKGGKEVEREAD